MDSSRRRKTKIRHQVDHSYRPSHEDTDESTSGTNTEQEADELGESNLHLNGRSAGYFANEPGETEATGSGKRRKKGPVDQSFRPGRQQSDESSSGTVEPGNIPKRPGRPAKQAPPSTPPNKKDKGTAHKVHRTAATATSASPLKKAGTTASPVKKRKQAEAEESSTIAPSASRSSRPTTSPTKKQKLSEKAIDEPQPAKRTTRSSATPAPASQPKGAAASAKKKVKSLEIKFGADEASEEEEEVPAPAPKVKQMPVKQRSNKIPRK
jgi:hypothetical protein